MPACIAKTPIKACTAAVHGTDIFTGDASNIRISDVDNNNSIFNGGFALYGFILNDYITFMSPTMMYITAYMIGEVAVITAEAYLYKKIINDIAESPLKNPIAFAIWISIIANAVTAPLGLLGRV